MDLSTPIGQVPRIGKVLEKRLKKLDVKTLQDLLYHFPLRYEDFSRFTPVAQLKAKTDVSIRGKVLEIKSSLAWRKKMTIVQALVEDETGAVRVVWFAKPYIVDSLKQDDEVFMAGRVSQGKRGLYLNNPTFEKISTEKDPEPSRVAGLMPIYPETERLSSRWLRGIIRPLLAEYKSQAQEFLPESLLKEFNFPPIARAIWQIHFPDSLELAKRSRARFSFEQLFLIELFILKERVKLLQTKAYPVPIDLPLVKRFVESLPFKLTDAQKKSAWQILKDLEKSHPMNRLLEGEVGSGKTVVATLATLNVCKKGLQVAMMAPTEILAKQHFKEVAKLLFPYKLTIALLTGKEDQIMAKKLKGETLEASRKKILDKCLNGDIDILIGTHALIQGRVRFKNLGLVVVDEQHRFGIEQRAKLVKGRSKKSSGQELPHLLSMTATPIPRSLALTIYGDLDLSIIDQLPLGRKKIITEVVPPQDRQRIYGFIQDQIELGRQAFVICPRIDAQDKKKENKRSAWSEVKAASEEKERLEKEIFPGLRIDLLHGRMTSHEKEKIMREFKSGKAKILVATSVVEVGIDIPNASVMVVEGSDRFGLAQLHQLRGRVGRSSYQSYCFLFTDSPGQKTKQRLEAILKAQDGFELAQKDLEIRGPGEFSGKKQSGLPDLAMESLKDLELVQQAKSAAREILENDMGLKNLPLLREKLKRFGERVHLE